MQTKIRGWLSDLLYWIKEPSFVPLIKKNTFMEVNYNDTLLRHEGSSAFNNFSLKFGEAIIIFAPPPTDDNVHYINGHKDIFCCKKEPCWVKCESYHCAKKDVRLINDHLMLFQKFGLFSHNDKHITQKDIDKLEGGEIRLMNTLLCRLKNETFIEVNIVGLAFDSIERLLKFIIWDISHHKVAYVIVDFTEVVLTQTNPIFVSNDTLGIIMNELESENEISTSNHEILNARLAPPHQ